MGDLGSLPLPGAEHLLSHTAVLISIPSVAGVLFLVLAALAISLGLIFVIISAGPTLLSWLLLLLAPLPPWPWAVPRFNRAPALSCLKVPAHQQ